MLNQQILQHFRESAELKMQSAELLAEPITQAVEIMFTALSNGNKILACGNGGSAADCQHFAAKREQAWRKRRGMPDKTAQREQSQSLCDRSQQKT